MSCQRANECKRMQVNVNAMHIYSRITISFMLLWFSMKAILHSIHSHICTNICIYIDIYVYYHVCTYVFFLLLEQVKKKLYSL